VWALFQKNSGWRLPRRSTEQTQGEV